MILVADTFFDVFFSAYRDLSKVHHQKKRPSHKQGAVDRICTLRITRMSNHKTELSERSGTKDRGVRKTLLMGVFWRILIIEVILLIGTLLYEAITRDAGASHLFWYALRILGLVAIIILFMMVTLQRFLRKEIITPLETIASANERFRKNDYTAKTIDLPERVPREIKGIVSTRAQMLEGIPKKYSTHFFKRNVTLKK